MRYRRKWSMFYSAGKWNQITPPDLLSFNGPICPPYPRRSRRKRLRRRQDRAAAGHAVKIAPAVGTRPDRPRKTFFVYLYHYQTRPKPHKTTLTTGHSVCKFGPRFAVAVTNACTVACPLFSGSTLEEPNPRGGEWQKRTAYHMPQTARAASASRTRPGTRRASDA